MNRHRKEEIRTMNPTARRWLSLLGLAVTVAACGSLDNNRSPATASYDLGLAAPVTQQGGIAPASIEVRAPSWLASTAMQYRLEYVQPSPRQAYVESRWASPPSEMLEVGLRRMLLPDGKGACRLRVDLDEFTQVYSTHASSQAVVAARIELLAPRGENVLARRDLSIVEPAPGADAAGGVTAHRRAIRRLAEELAGWLGSIAAAPEHAALVERACSKGN